MQAVSVYGACVLLSAVACLVVINGSGGGGGGGIINLNKALDFASIYDNITTEERNIIIHAKTSILIYKHIPWQKKGNATFDVTIGSLSKHDGDGSENVICKCNFVSAINF